MRFKGKLADTERGKLQKPETCIEREYYIDQGLTTRPRRREVAGDGRRRDRDDVAYYPVEHLSPGFPFRVPDLAPCHNVRESV